MRPHDEGPENETRIHRSIDAQTKPSAFAWASTSRLNRVQPALPSMRSI